MGAFRVELHDLERLTRRMAHFGEWRPALDFLAAAVRSQTSVRDYLAGEKMIQGFLAAYLGVTDHFLFSTEQEFNKGFVDICRAPAVARCRTARHGYLLELKYVKRDEGEAKLDAALAEAKIQLERYLADESLVRQRPEVSYTGLAVVFHGWEWRVAKPSKSWLDEPLIRGGCCLAAAGAQRLSTMKLAVASATTSPLSCRSTNPSHTASRPLRRCKRPSKRTGAPTGSGCR